MNSSSDMEVEWEAGTVGVPNVVRILLEDVRRRNDELAEQKARQDEKQAWQEKQIDMDVLRVDAA